MSPVNNTEIVLTDKQTQAHRLLTNDEDVALCYGGA